MHKKDDYNKWPPIILKIYVLKQFSSIRHKIHKKVQLSDLGREGGRCLVVLLAFLFLLQFLTQKKGAKAPCTPVQ